MRLSHRIRIDSTAAQRGYVARAAGTARAVWNWALAEWNRQATAGGRPNAMRSWTCGCAIKHDRDVNVAVNRQRLETGARAAQSALPKASLAATPGTAAGTVPAAVGKVTPARHEHGQQDGSGQDEDSAHFCAPS